MEALRTHSAGGIVIGDAGAIVLVQHEGSKMWLFPKGHVEEGESIEETARRELEEETGLTNLELLDDLGEYERPHILSDGTDDPNETKIIHMFLFAAPMHATLSPSLEIEKAQWFPFRELAQNISYEKDRVWYAGVAERVRQAIQRD